MWKTINLIKDEINLGLTLISGQCFNWSEKYENQYIGVLGDDLLILKQENYNSFMYQCLNDKNKDLKKELMEYFQLSVNISDLRKTWAEKDNTLEKLIPVTRGLRVIKQDLHECLFSFLASSNNNIQRITKILNTLRSKHGKYLMEYDKTKYHKFPTLGELQDISEEEYSEMGFGYRSTYYTKTVNQLRSSGIKWFEEIPNLKYSDGKKRLMELSGIGNKISDCILLYACNKYNTIPIDVHMLQIAKNYKIVDKNFKLTKENYEKVQDGFTRIFGDYSGWAHCILFANEVGGKRKATEIKGNNKK